MDIGQPRRIIEVEPISLPVPEAPDDVPAPSSPEPSRSEPAREPEPVPADAVS